MLSVPIKFESMSSLFYAMCRFFCITGLENEGTIDAWQLLSAIREKNLTLGVQYVKGEVESMLHKVITCLCFSNKVKVKVKWRRKFIFCRCFDTENFELSVGGYKTVSIKCHSKLSYADDSVRYRHDYRVLFWTGPRS